MTDHEVLVLAVQRKAHPEPGGLKAALEALGKPELAAFAAGFRDPRALEAAVGRLVEARGGLEYLEGLARGMDFDEFMAG
jgi:hypothetical protein